MKNDISAMGLLYGKRHSRLIKNLHTDPLGFYSDFQYIVTSLPGNSLLKLIARALFLALLIVSLPRLSTVISEAKSTSPPAEGAKVFDASLDPIKAELMPLLFKDLANKGLLKMGDRVLIVTGGDEDGIFKNRIVSYYKMDVISSSDSEKLGIIHDETYDFVFVNDFQASSELIERTLKRNGIVTVQLSENPAVSFQKPSNYNIVYLRRFDSTVVALKKTQNRAAEAPPSNKTATGRRLLGLTKEVKKKALNKLEDVLLEPPRAASGKSRTYRKKTRFLPDLIGLSLESYPRRVFIDVGIPDKNEKNSGDSSWFSDHYPTKNTQFDMYKIETVTEEPSRKEVDEIGMSDWLRKNVKENEYVVMKAEAEVVEDLIRNRAISLVDELFMECKHRGMKQSGRRRRAYWECLALYGRLRDEGIAVHQWWG